MSPEEYDRGPIRRVWCAFIEHPTAMALQFMLVPVGLIALILGSHASNAFDQIGGAGLVRVLGAVMLIGGLTTITGIIRSDAALEPIGLTFTAFGLGVYGGGVILWLGTQGLITGLIAVGASVGFLGRIRVLIREAPSRE